jgi:hypothetical protein
MSSIRSHSTLQEQKSATQALFKDAPNKQIMMMDQARKKATFDSQELTVIILGR